jgi:hypothetical protein
VHVANVEGFRDTGGGGILVQNQVGGTVNMGNIALNQINSSSGSITLDNDDYLRRNFSSYYYFLSTAFLSGMDPRLYLGVLHS